MWRALSVLDGELVCFLDADTEDFSAHFAIGPARPARVRAGRVVRQGASTAARCAQEGVAGDAEGGGRVNHLLGAAGARALLPGAGRRAPAARRRGRGAARAAGALPFATGYGVEIAMLIDAWRAVGLDGHRAGRPRRAPQPPPAAVGARADGATVLATVARRLEQEGRLVDVERSIGAVERAPLSARRWRLSVVSAARSRRCAALPVPRPRRHAARARRVAAARRRGERHDRRRARGAGVPARGRRGRADVGPPPRAGRRGRAAARPGARTSSRPARAWCSTARSTG